MMVKRYDPFALYDVALVDNHCHPLEKVQGHLDVTQWREHFTESSDSETAGRSAFNTAYYRRLTERMSRFYEASASEEEILEKRAAFSAPDLAGRLFRDGGIGGVILDLGYPDPSRSLTPKEFTDATDCQYGALIRVELLFQQRIVESGSFETLTETLREDLSDLRARGYTGMKSIAGYRTGLGIQRWTKDAALSAFAQARGEVEHSGAVRLGHKPLLDTLLHLAFEEASAQELPVQFHVGYGDRDVDLRTASPLELRPIMEDPSYRAMPIVLLHGCWPYFREGAFLTAVYPNVFLDLSFGIPFLSMAEMRSVTSAALGAAPLSKIMYSSDGTGIPEIFWMSAHDGRHILSSVLEAMVKDGDLTGEQAAGFGRDILANNAQKLYGLQLRD